MKDPADRLLQIIGERFPHMLVKDALVLATLILTEINEELAEAANQE
jgi:hypothetical protein